MSIRSAFNNFYQRAKYFGVRTMPHIQNMWNNVSAGARTFHKYSSAAQDAVEAANESIQGSSIHPSIKGHVAQASHVAGRVNANLQHAANKLLELQRRLGVQSV